MADGEPEFNQKDISDTNGPVDTKVAAGKTHLYTTDELSGKSNQIIGCPTISKKYRSNFSLPAIALTTSFQTAFSRTGDGKFFGFILDFSQGEVQVKFSIDSDVIFDLKSADIIDVLVGRSPNSGPASQNSSGGPVWEANTKRYAFYPPCPIEYETDVKIEVKKDGNPAPTLAKQIINLTEE